MGLRFSKTAVILFVTVVVMALAGGIAIRVVSEKMHMSAKDLIMEKPFDGRDQFTVMILGEDETFSKNAQVKGRSDTIMVASIDLKSKRVQGISIPRDTRVQLPGSSGYEKINAAHTHGGPQATSQAVADLLGVSIDYYIKTNIGGLKKVVDALGGVDIDIEKNMYYVDRRGGLFINLKKGNRHLDGDKALQYVRFRHDKMGDLWRIERQQKFLRSVARRMTAPENWMKLPNVIDGIMENVDTTLTSKDLLALARFSKELPVGQMCAVTLPGVPENIGHVSYYVPDTKAIPVVVNEVLKFQEPKPTVTVLNGSGITGAAERLAEFLRGDGYRIAKTGNAPRMDYTVSVVMAKDPSSQPIQKIADYLNCQPQSMQNGSLYDSSVVVIVGRDYSNL